MVADIEEILNRELHEVADGLHVPAMPPLPQQAPAVRRHWQPLLVAASVVLVVAGAVGVVTAVRGGNQEPEPAPSPSPSRTESVVRVATTAPTIPYVLDQRLYVDGEQVAGTWWSVVSADAGWLALRTDSTWWWGRGPEANRFDPPLDLPPVISPNGRYVAMVADDGGRNAVTGFATEPGGQGMGGVPVYPGNASAGDPVRVRAVTDDGRVIVQGSGTNMLWLPLVDNHTVDLTSTTPEGTTGGEVTALPELQAQTLDGTRQATLTAPAGWAFRVRAWAWEDADHLVSAVLRDGSETVERLARCSARSARCVLIDTR